MEMRKKKLDRMIGGQRGGDLEENLNRMVYGTLRKPALASLRHSGTMIVWRKIPRSLAFLCISDLAGIHQYGSACLLFVCTRCIHLEEACT